jgi:precorrin-3B synthase
VPTPPARNGPDHCPGALQVHVAADGGLVRVRVPGGVLSVAQLTALSRLARDFSDGSLEFTSRGNVQLRQIAPGAEGALASELEAAGLLPSLSHERVRNLIASALSGRDAAGLLDVRPLALALDQGLCADPVLAGLPGRFLFTVDDGRGDVTGLGADVGLLGTGPSELTLTLAGTDTGLRCTAADAPALALAAARAFLDERAAQGSSAWRLTELVDGPSRVAARLPGVRLDCDPDGHNPTAPPRAVGLVPQVNGLVAVGAVVPLGRLSGAQAQALVAAAGSVLRHAAPPGAPHHTAPSGPGASDHTAVVLITPWRSVVIPDLPPAEADVTVARLGSVGLVTDPASPWVGVTACAGQPGCAKALADVRSDAASTPVGPGARVHWIGCERGCGRPTGPHVEVRATTEGYRVDGRAVTNLGEAVTAARRSL